ncbi:MAG TPA: GAF domain-containing protein, partial [Mycobacterium sp.]
CLHVELTAVVRYEADGTLTRLASSGTWSRHLRGGAPVTMEGQYLAATVLRTGCPARIDTYDDAVQDAARAAGGARIRELGIRWVVAAPIMVVGRVWGMASVAYLKPELPPADTEERLGDFAELVATAIASAAARDELQASRDELAELAEQQAALRRVATLVARGVASSEVFAAVAEEMAQRLDVESAGLFRYEAGDGWSLVAVSDPAPERWPPVGDRMTLEGDNIPTMVLRTGRAARMHNFDNAAGSTAALARELGVRSAVGVPVAVDGRLWGAAYVASMAPEPLPPDTEARLGDFAELVATAIANAAARDELRELAEQQAALRRVATLVARGVGSSEVFSAVAEQMARCLHVGNAAVCRFEGNEVAVVAVSHFEPGIKNTPVVGERFPLEGDNFATRVFRTGRAALQDNSEWQNAPGPIAARLREVGLGRYVGVPIVVDGRVWGMASVGALERLPPDTEVRLRDFAELVATAIANAAARDELRELAKQQAALRRVATLVARGARPSEVYSAVGDEIVHCLDVDASAVWRYESDNAMTLLAETSKAGWQHFPVGKRFSLEGENIAAAQVLNTGRAARLDNHDNVTGSLAALVREQGLRCVVGAPVLVDGRVWGLAAVASSQPEPLPAHTEARLGDFAELVATAIANAANRDELQASRDTLRELARRQAALRRVATLVARRARPSQVYSAVADEIVHCLDVDTSGVWRYESDNALTLLAGTSKAGRQFFPVGERLTIEGDNLGAMVLGSGRPARHRRFANDTGSAIARIREVGIREGVGAPIIVDGRVWGLAIAATTRPEPLPSDTEERIGDFADLVATALANAATHDELIASRARIVAAADDARHRIERDLHDGAQQRIVSLGLQLRLAEDSVPVELRDVREQLSSAVSGVNAVSSELQRISRGIHPAIQSVGGLGPALKLLARRCPVPVHVDVTVKRRLPDPVEVAAYYVVAEALTNTAKYAQASVVKVCAETQGANLVVSVDDDGIGGADPRKGSGLIGLKDRVEVLGGDMQVTSIVGSGTSLRITIPVTGHDSSRLR